MPTTINGVGTHYYGKSNKKVRTAACHACGRVGELQSYDTRLWFVVVFVPVIPLGRKTIIDECPSCRRHYVTDQDQFAMARQLSLSGAREQFRADPTAETAATVHVQMLGYHAHDDAKAFREEALAQFPDDAALHAGIAAQLDAANDHDAATPLLERAHELSPDMPEARYGLALRRIVDGKLDDARALIAFMEQPGAGLLYPLDRLEHLANAYQKAGRHKSTLELCQVLIREFPQVAEDHRFRKFVATSEKALATRESILPEQGWSWRALFDAKSMRFSTGQRWAAYLTVVAALAALGMAGLNEYRRYHRTVFVQNDFGPAAQVTIDGAPVPDGPRSEVALAEGTHHVKVTGAIEEVFDVDLATNYWQRWTHSPAWIINVGGAAPVMHDTLHYAEIPQPSESQLFAGKHLCFVPHVDYLFTEGPRQLQVDDRSNEVIKQQLTIAPQPASLVLQMAMELTDAESALRYGESRLLIDPADDQLAAAYVGVAAMSGQLDRAKAFFRGRLARRPVEVNWHRMYHELHPKAAEQAALIAEYDQLLAADPNSAALLYLRGRLSPAGEADQYFDRAIAADPQHHWPWYAKGYRACALGDWALAKRCYEEALRLGQSSRDVQAQLMTARLGLGEADALAREYREALTAAAPEDALEVLVRLIAVLGSQGDAAGARQAIDNWAATAPAEQQSAQMIEALRELAAINANDFAAIEQRAAAGQASPDVKLNWLLAVGRAEDAATDATLAAALEDPWKALALSLALELAGRRDDAIVWRRKACNALGQLGLDEVRAVELLQADSAPTQDDLDSASLAPMEKALLAATLAMKFPEQRAELAALADRMAVLPSDCAPLVRQVVALVPEAAAP